MALFSWANGIFIEYRSMTTKFITDSVLRNSEHKKVSLDSWSPKKKHYFTMVENREKHRQNSHLIIPFPTSEGVSEVSERANERTDERVAQYCSLYFWLLSTIVYFIEFSPNAP